jgi:hypothetical protein
MIAALTDNDHQSSNSLGIIVCLRSSHFCAVLNSGGVEEERVAQPTWLNATHFICFLEVSASGTSFSLCSRLRDSGFRGFKGKDRDEMNEEKK